jgi:hypothetical protein
MAAAGSCPGSGRDGRAGVRGDGGGGWGAACGGCQAACAGRDRAFTNNHALPNGDYRPYIYVGPYTSSAASPVVDSGTNPVGAQRCLGGALSGEVCGNTVVSPLVMVLNGGGAVAGIWLLNTSTPAAGNGDSGGPACTADPETGDITAMGIIEAGDPSYRTAGCNGIPVGNGRQCYSRVMIVDLDSALNSINAGLVVAPRTMPAPSVAVRSGGEADVAAQGTGNSTMYYWAVPGGAWNAAQISP